MKYKITVLRLAQNDLHEIHKYLSEFGENPPKKFRNSFERFIEQISNMPYMFSEYEHNPNYRKSVLVFGYLVFYRINEHGHRVKIYRILHGKRNIDVDQLLIN
ncbi:MAG: type II toxin-antitoxin system RelE/ParE family toxin [Peptococcaceae bacterium]|nr:type II toxin-antitoxin system RelE/ParE family toxin [Peptococcaceae bacterium]